MKHLASRRRERRVQDRLAVHAGRLAASVLECVHFAVQDGTALLHATVVSAPDDDALVHDDRTDGNSALGQTQSRLVDRSLQERVPHIHGRSLLRFDEIIVASLRMATIRRNRGTGNTVPYRTDEPGVPGIS